MNSRQLTALAIVACGLLLSSSLMAGPITVKINDVPNAAPVITVVGAPDGYDIYTGELVATPGVEEGALITLYGVSPVGLHDKPGWRFLDPRDPESLPPLYVDAMPGVNVREFVMAVDIVWTQHDPNTGDLQIGFDSALPGTWYRNPGIGNTDEDAGTVTNKWVTLYADDEIVLMFKPHTYILKK